METIDNSKFDKLIDNKPIIDVPGVPLEDRIKTWKDQYTDIYELTPDETEEFPELNGMRIICKAPGRTNLSRFIKDVTAGDALKAQNNFFYDNLLYPDAEVIKKLVDKKPGLIVALGNQLQTLTGINQNFLMKKL